MRMLAETQAVGWFFPTQAEVLDRLLGNDDVIGFITLAARDEHGDDAAWDLWVLGAAGLLRLTADLEDKTLRWARYPSSSIARVVGRANMRPLQPLHDTNPVAWLKSTEVDVLLPDGEAYKFSGAEWAKSHEGDESALVGALEFFCKLA